MNESASQADLQRRERALARYELHTKTADEICGNVANVAALLCETPFAAVTVLADSKQFFKDALGFSLQTVTSEQESFCQYTTKQKGALIVPDATVDPRFQNSIFVTGTARVRFYAGCPIFGGQGAAIGSLCVLDVVPRGLLQEQSDGLSMLAEIVTSALRSQKIA